MKHLHIVPHLAAVTLAVLSLAFSCQGQPPNQQTTANLDAANVFTSPLNSFRGITASSVTDTGLTPGRCVQASTGGLLTTTSAACGAGSGGGTVTSVGLIGTSNQITVTGTSPITSSGSWTLSLPTTLTLPGTINGLTLTSLSSGFSLSGGTTTKILTVDTTLALSSLIPPPSVTVLGSNSGSALIAASVQGNGSLVQLSTGATTSGHCAQFDASGNTIDSGVGCGTGAVVSVFGRTGAVAATSGDYTVSQVTGAAPLASPTFTGTVGGITAAMVGLGSVTNDTQTKASIVPNTAPSAGGILIGNSGGTAYASIVPTGDWTMTSAGVTTNAKINGITVTGTPSTGYVPTATGSTAATWQAQKVVSVFGRTGAVVSAASDYDFTQLSGTLAASQVPTGGAATQFLYYDGTWQTPAGAGNVSNSGTPTNVQMAQWTGATTIKGIAVTGTGDAVLADSPTLTTALTLSFAATGCLQSTSGVISSTGTACGSGSGMVYPAGSGVPVVVSGTSWGTTLSTTGSGDVVLSASPTFSGTVVGLTSAEVGLGSVTNDVQTKASVVPNTAPAAAQILVAIGGGGAYSPVSVSGDSTITSAGVVTNSKLNNAVIPLSAAVVSSNSSRQLVAASLQGNGSKVQLSTGSTTTNDCVLYDSNGNVIDSGAPCKPTFPVTVAGTVVSGGVPYFNSTTQESSSALLPSGAVVIGGGAGNPPSGSLANATLSTGALTLGSSGVAGSVVLNGATSGTATLSVSATLGTLNLGSTNATVDASGNLTVVSCLGCGVASTPGGSNTQLQYNNSSAFGGVSGWTTNGTTTMTGGATSVLNLSAMAPASGLKLPTVAGAIPTADGFIGVNSTNHDLVWGSNGTTLVGAIAATGTGTATTCSNEVFTAISAVAVPTCTTLTSAYLPAATPQSITNDTNVTGSITAQVLTLGWTGTLAKTRTLATTVYTDQSNTYSTGTQDMSSATAFKAPVGAGLTTAANGALGYDTTNKNWHGYQNGTDSYLISAPVSGTYVNGNCVQWAVASGVITLSDTGSACGSGGGGGGSSFPITVSGTVTSGGIPYFNLTTQESSSGLLAANSPVLGGGAGGSPKTVAGISTDGVSVLTLGVAGTSVGGLALHNATSGILTLAPPTGALGTVTVTVPAATDTLVNLSGIQTLTNKSITASEINSGQLAFAQGGTNASTATAAFNNLSPMTTLGDIIYGGTSGAGTRLAIGTAGQCLQPIGGVPGWGSCGGISGSGLASTQVLVATSTSAATSYSGFTSDSSGNVTAHSVTTSSSGGVAGALLLGQGTAHATGTVSVGLTAPTSVTAYNIVLPGTAGTGNLNCTGSGATDTCSWIASNITPVNCAAVGTAANPSVASCGAATAGSFSCSTSASAGTCRITTTAITADSEVRVQQRADTTTGTRLGVTCSTVASKIPVMITNVAAGTSFTVTLGSFSANPECFSFVITN